MIVDVFDRKRSSRCCVCLVAGILSFFPPLQIAASSERPNRKVIHECEWVDSRCVESLAMAVVLLIECFLCIYKKNREREGKVFLSSSAPPPPPPPPPPPFFSPFFFCCVVSYLLHLHLLPLRRRRGKNGRALHVYVLIPFPSRSSLAPAQFFDDNMKAFNNF